MTSIFVDNDDVESFEKYLNNEQDNIFAHAVGGNVEYYFLYELLKQIYILYLLLNIIAY